MAHDDVDIDTVIQGGRARRTLAAHAEDMLRLVGRNLATVPAPALPADSKCDRVAIRAEFVCRLLPVSAAEGTGTGSAALILRDGELRFSIEVYGVEAVRSATVVSDSAGIEFRLALVKDGSEGAGAYCGTCTTPAVLELESHIAHGCAMRLEILTDTAMMWGPTRRVAAQ